LPAFVILWHLLAFSSLWHFGILERVPMNNFKYKDRTGDGLEACFGIGADTVFVASRNGEAKVLVEFRPQDIVQLRDWLTNRIDYLKSIKRFA
jgi:hypothetical protein